VHADRGRSRDDAAVALLLEEGPGGLGDGVRALEVRRVDGVPLGLGHGGERLVAEDAGVADDGCEQRRGRHEREVEKVREGEEGRDALWRAPNASTEALTSFSPSRVEATTATALPPAASG